jgi:hypothetical protein
MRGMGKQFGGKSMGKMLQPTVQEEDSDSSSSEEEPWNKPAVPRAGQGKQLRPPPAAAAA